MTTLEIIADADAGFPTAQAQGILSFFYDYIYELELDLGGANLNSSGELSESLTAKPNRITT